MRRRLAIFIPIVLLTVLVQLIAPIGAFRAVANAVSDPLYMASICSGSDSESGHATLPGGSAAHSGCCSVCGGGLGGAAVIDPPPLGFVTLQRQYQRLVWLDAWDALPIVRLGSNTQARAPPAIS